MVQTFPQNPLCSVALLCPAWPPGKVANGIVSYVSSIREGMEQAGVRMRILTPLLAEDCRNANVYNVRPRNWLAQKLILKFNLTGWDTQRICRGLRRTIRRLHSQEGLELVEMEESFGWARFVAGRVPVPVLVRLHGPWFLNGAASGFPEDAAFFERVRNEEAAILAANAITGPSSDVIERTRAYYKTALPGARAIANPVLIPGEHERWKAESCEQNRIVFVGRFDRHKGADTMLEAFKIIHANRPDVWLDFVGPDFGMLDESGKWWSMDEYLGEKMTASERERIERHGFQPAAALKPLRRRARVAVVPSRYETFGMTAAEAMAMGCPIVACDGGALKELVEEGVTGRLASAGNAADVAEKVLALLDDLKQSESLGRQAAVVAAQRFSPLAVAQQSAEFYRWVIDRP